MLLCAAIKYRVSENCTVVIPCVRHIKGFALVRQLGLETQNIIEEGFVDTENRFYSRKEAVQEARRCGQIPQDFDLPILFSEHLY